MNDEPKCDYCAETLSITCLEVRTLYRERVEPRRFLVDPEPEVLRLRFCNLAHVQCWLMQENPADFSTLPEMAPVDEADS